MFFPLVKHEMEKTSSAQNQQLESAGAAPVKTCGGGGRTPSFSGTTSLHFEARGPKKSILCKQEAMLCAERHQRCIKYANVAVVSKDMNATLYQLKSCGTTSGRERWFPRPGQPAQTSSLL